jgi:hypothetical protein
MASQKDSAAAVTIPRALDAEGHRRTHVKLG